MQGLKKKLTNNRASLEVNLEELFGAKVPNNSSLRQAIGQAIIDKIQDRTADNVGADGKRFKNYSKAYAESLAFAAYDKSKNDPNLKQTGDMLGLMDVIAETKNKITIGWNDSDQSAKAHGHVTGNIGVKRDFLGLTKEEIKDLRSEFMPALEEAESEKGLIDSVRAARAFITGAAQPRTRGFNDVLRDFLDDDE